jgi:5'-3' exonuclease
MSLFFIFKTAVIELMNDKNGKFNIVPYSNLPPSCPKLSVVMDLFGFNCCKLPEEAVVDCSGNLDQI